MGEEKQGCSGGLLPRNNTHASKDREGGGGAAGSPKTLVECCTALLIKRCSVRNVLQTLEVAQMLGMEVLQGECERWIAQGFEGVCAMAGQEAVEAVLDPDLFAALRAESEECERALRVRRLLLEGSTVREPQEPPPAPAPPPSPATAPPEATQEVSGPVSKARGRRKRGKRGGRRHRKQKGGGEAPEAPAGEVGGAVGGAGVPVYPLEALLAGVRWPDDVDPEHRELHLPQGAFEGAMGVGYGEYKAMPRWRKVMLKREAGLF